MQWLVETLKAHPELTFFLVLGIGYLLGHLRIGSFQLGAVTGTLLAGVAVGQLGLQISPDVKQCFFLLFLFAIGFRIGPQFFRGLRGGGLKQAGLATVTACAGLAVAYATSLLLGYDMGTAGGLIAGSMTESATIGTAGDAIARLKLAPDQRSALINNIPVAFAVTYLIGVVGTTWFLPQIGPKLLGVDLVEECRKLEQQMGGGGQPALTARREFEFRSYEILAGSLLDGMSVGQIETAVDGQRIFVEGLRRDGELLDIAPQLTFRAGDVFAVSGRREFLAARLDTARGGIREVDDRELLEVGVEALDVVVANRDLDGRTLRELGGHQASRGVFLRKLTRGGTVISHLPETAVNMGDVLTLVGPHRRIGEAARLVGFADRLTEKADIASMALGIVAGGLVGIPALMVSKVELGLSMSVGVLLGGLVCGWLRSVRPRWVGRIPGPTLWAFESIGLTGFIAVAGLNAGPAFVRGLQESGLTLLLAGFACVVIPLSIGILAGRFLFRMHPGVVLGVVAGAYTATPALAAVQEAAKSSVPTLGYGVAYAVGNVLLALWGTVIVALLS